MSTEEQLNNNMELLRRKLNDSIKTREDLKELYKESVELDQLMEQYIQQEKEKEES